MNSAYIHNGTVIVDGRPTIGTDNRGFKYGDGLFESIRIANNRICFLENHVQRAKEGMKALKIEIPEHFTADYFQGSIRKLMELNGIDKGGRVRLSIFREASGAYLPSGNQAGFILEASPMEDSHYQINKKGLTINVFPEMHKTPDKLSKFKISNGLLSVMASLYAQEQGLDDALLLDQTGKILEASSSNIFVLANGVLYTPSLDEGCVGGVMRMQVINLALESKFTVYECSLRPQHLLDADEIFLTNAIKGIQWVGSYQMKRYYQRVSAKLLTRLNEKMVSLEKDPQGSSPTSSTSSP